MDASGQGLCALEPNFKRYIRQRFSHEESKTLSINVRELRSAVLAVLRWGPHWHIPTSTSPLHVQFHIDNTSAVTWANKRASKHPTAQLYNRLLSLAEFQYNLVCTATHIPGKLNVMADAGSRAWSSNDQAAKLWTNFSAPWLQDHIEPPFDDLSAVWDRCYSDTPWQALPIPNISRIGVNGADSRTKWGGYFATVSWAHGANRYQRGNQLGTINLKLASVKWFHRRYKDLTLPATPRLAMLLQGIKRLSSPKRKKQPLTMPFLRLLRRSLDFSKPRQRLLWGSILIGFFFMLRRSEYLMIDHTRHFYCLKNSNAFFSDKDGQEVGSMPDPRSVPYSESTARTYSSA
ncbi:uncharacterized protein PITG_21748 [Phytophthora infestans T30-4]|uniref:Uncharacterized protein n=1 Tax=Phytophthora infestans (strain T30-4) TaxID=403677 RepID=D0P499_PHYIT|nr:uncharacterized protein PITG_21748 [Phytophthora infestans T30-4]EEY64408.1 conserved hypothetical protein [Phytophthora infestans T30-4]|eukprot:XP_002894875.1 conserved hypothetical protein [Phytophthora infestans T30-4]